MLTQRLLVFYKLEANFPRKTCSWAAMYEKSLPLLQCKQN